MKKSDVALIFKGADEKSWQELLDDLRPKGEWVGKKTHFGDLLHCSLCGAKPRRSEYGYDLHDSYCHNCGADMQVKRAPCENCPVDGDCDKCSYERR